MSKQAGATMKRGAECCASVLAAPVEVTDAAELATGFTALADPWPRASQPCRTTSRS